MDKLYHFAVNLALSLISILSFEFALGICIGASIGKEVGDEMAKGANWDWKDSALDLVADGLGMTIGFLFVRFMKQI